MKSSPVVIWRFVDGKAGHEKQTQACVEALANVREITLIDIPVTAGPVRYITRWIRGHELFNTSAIKSSDKPPQLIIGAGHLTHIPMLIAKYQQACPVAVIMSPSLPSAWFDVIIAPEHDFLYKAQPDNVLTTLTALAPMVASKPDENKGIILLGGVSKHFDWDDQQLIDNIQRVLAFYGKRVEWQLSTSRRTPKSTLQKLKQTFSDLENLKISDYKELGAQWLPTQLKTAGKIWVTSDSASMLAEALNTRSEVGLLQLSPKGKKHKFSQTHQKLIDLGALKHSQSLSSPEGKKTAKAAISIEPIIEELVKRLGL